MIRKNCHLKFLKKLAGPSDVPGQGKGSVYLSHTPSLQISHCNTCTAVYCSEYQSHLNVLLISPASLIYQHTPTLALHQVCHVPPNSQASVVAPTPRPNIDPIPTQSSASVRLSPISSLAKQFETWNRQPSVLSCWSDDPAFTHHSSMSI